jgi:ABC-type nitrate/sulfonate/bicarbonate transport system substrate-binding protein
MNLDAVSRDGARREQAGCRHGRAWWDLVPVRCLAMLLAVFGMLCGNVLGQDIPVRIAYPSGINGELSKVIEKAGIAQKYGLAPTFSFFQYGPPMIEALAAGQVDVVFTSFTSAALYLAKDPGGLAIIADVGSGRHAVLVPQDSPIRSLKDFAGRKIAVSYNSEMYVDVARSLKGLGLEPGKGVDLVNVQPLELAATYMQHLTDGVDIRIPQMLALTSKGGTRIVQEWPWQFLVVVRKGFLDAHPGVADKLRQVVGDGIWYIASHPDDAAKWWSEQLGLSPEIVKASADLNPAYHAKSREDVNVIPSAELKQRADAWAQDLVNLGVLKQKVIYIYE